MPWNLATEHMMQDGVRDTNDMLSPLFSQW